MLGNEWTTKLFVKEWTKQKEINDLFVFLIENEKQSLKLYVGIIYL